MITEARIKRVERAKKLGSGLVAGHGVPVHSRISPSAFSPRPQDRWIRGCHPLRYEIVLLPGYVVPSRLVREDIDSIWFEGEVTKPVVVYDGMHAEALFEIISECIDPAGEVAGCVVVRDRDTGLFVEDPRPADVLASRPSRRFPEDMLSAKRQEVRSRHFDRVAEFYRETMPHLQASGGNSQHHVFATTNVGQGMWHETVRGGIAYYHPQIEQEDFFEEDREAPAPEGLRFGYDLYRAELRKKDPWYLDQRRLELLIEIGEVTTPYQVASYKETRGIPLSKVDERALTRGGSAHKDGFTQRFISRVRGAMRADRA